MARKKAAVEPGIASARADQDSAGAESVLGAISAQLTSLTEDLNKAAVNRAYVGDRAFTTSKQETDYMGEEIAGTQALDDAIVGKTNRKILMDDVLFDLSMGRKQYLRHVDQVLANSNNQFGQNNAMSLNGVDKLQNDIEDGVKIASILAGLSAQIVALSEIVGGEEG